MQTPLIQRELLLEGAEGRPFSLDYTLLADGRAKPVVVFCHGFKGFKDWGHWQAMAVAFAKRGYCFVKFNFSHNGTRPETPLDFSDLEAFGRNTYGKELYDLKAVLDRLYSGRLIEESQEANPTRICLTGHSRGGGIALLQAARDPRIKALVTWASVARLDYSWQDPQRIRQWEKEGVLYAFNTRTKQQMPLYFELYRDFQAHQKAYDLCRAASSLRIPYLIVHGSKDPAVSPEAAHRLKQCKPSAELAILEGADHVFGGRHPWREKSLPPHSLQVIDRQISFLAKAGLSLTS